MNAPERRSSAPSPQGAPTAAHRLPIDSDPIRLALDRLTRGEWQIDQAIDYLQSAPDAARDTRSDEVPRSARPRRSSGHGPGTNSRDDCMRVADAIRQWGPPPGDVLQEWMSQIRGGENLSLAPENVDWNRWQIDGNGQLRPVESADLRAEPVRTNDRVSESADDSRVASMADHDHAKGVDNDSPPLCEILSASSSTDSVADRSRTSRTSRRWVAVAAPLLILALAIGGWWGLGGSAEPPIAATTRPPTPSGEPSVPAKIPAKPTMDADLVGGDGPLTTVTSATDFAEPDLGPEIALDADWQTDTGALRNMAESMFGKEEAPVGVARDDPRDVSQSDAAIASLLSPNRPSTVASVGSSIASGERPMDAPENARTIEAPPKVGGPEIDLMTDDGVDADQSDEADVQPVQDLPVAETEPFVTLPSPSESPTVSLPIQWNASTQLQHPSDDRLRMSQTENAYEILSGEKRIAEVRLDPEAPSLRWIDATGGEQTRLRQSRFHSSGEPLYLRSPVVADPWRFRFEDFDRQPVWELGTAPVPSVSSLDVEVQIPEQLTLGWIEKPEQWSMRGDRAIGVITADDDEGVAIGFRIDVTAGRRLSVRIRTAARMSSSDPWHALSNGTVSAAEDAWASQAQWASLEKQRLARVDEVAYEIGGSRGKRIIDAKQDRIEQYIDAVQTTLSNLQRLREMVAQLESAAVLRIRIQTHWSDGVQPILSMRAGLDGDDG